MLCSIKTNPHRDNTDMRKKALFITSTLVGGCLVAFLFYGSHKNDDSLSYNGKPLRFWWAQALTDVPQGNYEKSIKPTVEKMGPEAIPFFLQQLRTTDSTLDRAYAKLWSSLPNRIRPTLPPVSQHIRRNVAYSLLSNLYYTNGIPELIRLSYSKDIELQFYAVNLLWSRAFHFYEPSTECIAAFCSALQARDARTRLSAVDGLSILPLRREALPALHLALKDTEEEIRVKAASVIIKLEPERDLTSIFQAGLLSANPNVKVISSVTLSRLKLRQKTTPADSALKTL